MIELAVGDWVRHPVFGGPWRIEWIDPDIQKALLRSGIDRGDLFISPFHIARDGGARRLEKVDVVCTVHGRTFMAEDQLCHHGTGGFNEKGCRFAVKIAEEATA